MLVELDRLQMETTKTKRLLSTKTKRLLLIKTKRLLRCNIVYGSGYHFARGQTFIYVILLDKFVIHTIIFECYVYVHTYIQYLCHRNHKVIDLYMRLICLISYHKIVTIFSGACLVMFTDD